MCGSEGRPEGSLDLDRSPYVHYEIHLHPTYRVPYLWFHMRNLPHGEDPMDIDTVYRRLVPDHLKSTLRDSGVQGGISANVCALLSMTTPDPDSLPSTIPPRASHHSSCILVIRRL